jgi:outer membrane protein assembly factor BamB
MPRYVAPAVLALAAAVVVVPLWAQSRPAAEAAWPCHRGPSRDGISTEKDWLGNWPAGAKPTVAWTAEVGKGHSAIVVAAGRCYTMGSDGKNDIIRCLDAATGREVWKQSYACDARKEWSGPRATPTLDNGVVYTLSQHGHLRAYDAAKGQLKWEVRLPEAANPNEPYGHSWSPLVQGDLLILSAGRGGLAVRKSDGSVAWGDPKQPGTCASAVPYQHKNVKAVAVAVKQNDKVDIVGVDPARGMELWRFAGWPEPAGDFCVDPIVRDGKVFITTGERHHKCARISFDGPKPKVDWENANLASNTGQCVLVGDYLYGVGRSSGSLTCLKWDTGERVWKEAGFGEFGTLMAADGKLIIMSSKGTLVIAEANGQKYVELRRVEKLLGDTFTTPTLAAGRIYCRDYSGKVVCLATGK